jgi:MFS family permease
MHLWPILILGFVGFVTSFGAHIVAVNLPVYAEQVGVGVAVIGLLIAVYDLAELVAKPVFGALADRRGMKQTMLAGIALFTLASLAYRWVDPRLLVLIRFLQGVGAAALSAVSLAMVGAYALERRGQTFPLGIHAARSGQVYGIYNAIKGAGYVVSPVIGGAIVWRSDFAAIFLAAAMVGAVAFLLSLLLPRTQGSEGAVFNDEDGLSLKAIFAVFRQASLWPWYVVTVVNMFFVGILFGFLPVRVHALSYDPLVSGVMLSAVTASYLLVQPLAGVLADRLNPAVTIRLGLALSGTGILLAPFVSGAPLVAVSILAGIGVGTVWTNTDALISNLAQAGRLGATMGAAGTFKELGDMLGPLLIGLVSQAFGLAVGFVFCGVLGLLLLVLVSFRDAFL